MRPTRRTHIVFAACIAIASCTSYEPLPLADSPGLAASIGILQHDRPLPAGPLAVSDIVCLVVENNPDLVATRAQHGVAQAQLLQAGLPPNPSIAGAVLPLAAGVGTTTAYNAGLTYDLKSLITLEARRTSAEAATGQIDAQILWQEWQLVGQARLLAVDLIQGERSLRSLHQSRDMLTGRLAVSRQALAAGNATLATLAPDLAALQATRTQSSDLARLQLQRRHQLNALLGLQPDVEVPLADMPDLPPFDPAGVLRDLPGLAARRPDLVALQLGYRSQDQKLRAAILGQFPNLTFGITGGSDNSNVRNIGPQLALELSLFDRNQGNIAIERATRQQLHDEFSARLAAAHGQVAAMISEIAQLSAQLAASRRDAADLRRAAGAATAAFNSGNLDERSYVDMVSTRLAKDQEILGLEQSILEQQVAIATLTGAGMPAAATIPPVQEQP